jgi:ribosomal protein S18 acetylase RimI-like enzyme
MDRGELQGAHNAFAVARATEFDWQHLRTVRLAALAESPEAFGSDYASEAQFSEDDWREWARNTATFLALKHQVPIGIVAGVPTDAPDERKLIAAWIHPDHRGHGVAAALVEAVQRWARAERAMRLSLWVTQTNQPAVNLYRRLGFTPTGHSKPLPSDPRLTEDGRAARRPGRLRRHERGVRTLVPG